jgi:outer membrane receptor protein involved in Fe transport
MPPKDSAALVASQRERNRFGVLTYQAFAGTDVDLQVSLFTRSTDVHYRPDPVGDLQYNGIAADILRRNTAQGLQADLSWRVGKAHTVRAGLFAQRETTTTDNRSKVFPADPAGNPTSAVPIGIDDGTRIQGRLWGAYVQDEWQPTRAVTLNYGLRWDQINSVVDENQLSPRLGMVVELSKDLRLHAGYARYFTPPPTEKIDTTSVAKFLGTTNALPSDANTAVKSERSDYFDAGFSWQASTELTLGVDAYYRKVGHLQDEGQFGNALIFSAFNFAEGRIFGLDLSGSYRTKTISGYLNLGLSHARGRKIETGQFNFDETEQAYLESHWAHLDHEQWLSLSAGMAWQLGGGLSASADALMGTGMRNGFANTAHLPGYATLNLALTKPFDLGPTWGKLDARLAIVNAFDRTYQLRDGTGIGVGAPQFGARRTFYVGISKSY